MGKSGKKGKSEGNNKPKISLEFAFQIAISCISIGIFVAGVYFLGWRVGKLESQMDMANNELKNLNGELREIKGWLQSTDTKGIPAGKKKSSE